MTGTLEGKIALVTGAASGIGLETARLLAREGARLVIGDIDDPAGEKARRELEELGTDALYVHCDVTEDADVKALVDTAISRFGRLDVAINNAGIGSELVPLHETPLDFFDTMLA